MRSRVIKLLAGASLFVCAGLLGFLRGNTSLDLESELTSTGRGSVETLLANYREWEAAYIRSGGDRNMVLPLGPFKGLATEYSDAFGQATVNVIDGTVSVEVKKLPTVESWDVWLIDNRPGPGRSVMPEPGDTIVRLGSLEHEGGLATLEVTLGSDAFAHFEPDLIIVTRTGKTPEEHRLLVGTTTLFHRLFRSGQRGQFGRLSDGDQPEPNSKNGFFFRLFETLSPTALAQIGPIPKPRTTLERLITAGRQSFFNDTFNGNGRTCGTCHRENNNLTIDPAFIATLPPNDPLFVAEFNPDLKDDFEKPILMRTFGLILENVDGFGDLANNFVMRGVPHTLALLQNTLTPVAGGADGTTLPPNERTGWGGDGAPGTGTLREFIIGAITQHYPKTLNRVPRVDFDLPTVAQMDALEAFMRSTGRRKDLVLTGPDALRLKSKVAARGQDIFNNPGPPGFPGFPAIDGVGAGKCFFCHLNAGASDFFFPGQNANFNTNVEGLPGQPARLVDPTIPPDGGFGREGSSPTGGIGNGTFNTPVLVEAADTGPFFHNNSISTIEGAIAFFNSDAFNKPPGFGALIGGIRLEPTEIEAVAAFLRVINALENLRSSKDLAKRATRIRSSDARELLMLSISEIGDATDVLKGGGLHPEAQGKLQRVVTLYESAIRTPGSKNAFIKKGLALTEDALDDLQVRQKGDRDHDGDRDEDDDRDEDG